ncbi:B-cell receptor CD22 [Hemibagrus wyckioides]|uniref:B-cell receptor CD22 n=1 Tax=Hemibagrus wyckioides TaxID=337641 RepID=UPI00266D6354|nr:B-cell receptor CD22 [Hemibagrus wyckioides]XP_058269938.1 B-cell receptor CD22 [Hemibagrus wyckioides]XP_058269939.1 B-cell receptor CD22 [Hemibagrus wyckioides]XP_058269940.1 B-cell receptor CD22 [Hemibagrus wyckioides]XP_058269941.1 B-cell receptor CD22 [Hemibagrus wyckioides]
MKYLQKQPEYTVSDKKMPAVWNSVHAWAFLCLFSLIAMANSRDSIILTEGSATKQEGSCVTINCKYIFEKEMQLLWFKNPKWNDTTKRFDGTFVYSNTKERPQDPEYSNRVIFHEDTAEHQTWATCTLKINDLKVKDSGIYTFRYIKGTNKFMSSAFSLTVMANPCKVHITKAPNLNDSLVEGDKVEFRCATSAACESFPLWQVFGSSEVPMNKDSDGEKYSELTLNLNWKDDGKTLTCHPPKSLDDACQDRSVKLRVEYAPKETKVTEISNPKDVKEGEQVEISCSTKAQPMAQFTWFKDQSSFSIGETLTLNVMTPEDGGRFYCQAKNKHGYANSSDIEINVIYAPKDVEISPQLIKKLIEGEMLTLTCLAQRSKPAVYSYRWYRNGQEMNLHTADTFYVTGVTRTDNGDYQCEAKNSVGETKSTNTVKVSVMHVPQNANIQGTMAVKSGFTLNLKCDTEASPPPKIYYWYFKPEQKQQFLLLSNTNQVYWIEKVAVSNAGVYVCSAENDIGTGANSSEVDVLVYYPPKKTNLTMKQVVKENELFSVTCTVESSPQAELTLSRATLTNPEKDKIIKKFQANFFNFTWKVSMYDAGVYTCTAENSEGQSSSKNRLEVLYAPKNVKVSAYPGEELKEGSELRLTCTAKSLPQVSAYTWKKNFGAHSVILGHNQALIIRSVKSSDSDHYSCIPRNEIGSAESPTIYIRVKYQPQVTLTHNMTSMGLFEEAVPVHLSCSVQCYPPATSFAWYKLEENTAVLSNDQNYTVQPQNPGMYYCEASNEMGKSTSEPVKISNNSVIQLLIKIVISLLVILILIGVMFLLHRIIKTKRCLGKNEAAQQSFFVSAVPLWSNLRSSGSRNNTRENLVTEGSSEIFGFRDTHSSAALHSNPPANRNTQAGRPNYDIQTTYDVIKLSPNKKQVHHSEEDLTTVNYAMLQFMDSNKPSKSVSSRDTGDPEYAKVVKKKQMANEQQGVHEDYVNVSGLCTTKQPFPSIDWDSDTSESEDEVNYTKVSFTATSHHNPQKDRQFSDEEDKTEYTEVKI